MQYINDDMDDLFRRAAEDYPLNTAGCNWNVIVKKLPAETFSINDDDNRRNKKYKRLLLLLLLLPVLWLGKNYFYQYRGDNGNQVKTGKDIASKDKLSSPGFAIAIQPVNRSTSSIKPVLRNNRNVAGQLPVQKKSTRYHKGTVQYSFSTSTGDDIIDTDKPGVTITENENDAGGPTGNAESVAANQKSTNKNSVAEDHDTTNEGNKTLSSINRQEKQKKNGVYAGVVVSPDISTIKFQEIKHVGLSFGIVMGYQVNKNIDIETGLGWSKKYYHSDGKYFNAKNIVLATNTEIKKLDGTCSMLEIPVTIRYNIRSSPGGNLSVSGGMSSYIMKKENYSYTIEHSGVQYPRNAGYRNSSSYMFATANVHFGYNFNLRRKALIRLESYVKLPVRGFGIGNLPIMSTGVNIAVIQKLFK